MNWPPFVGACRSGVPFSPAAIRLDAASVNTAPPAPDGEAERVIPLPAAGAAERLPKAK